MGMTDMQFAAFIRRLIKGLKEIKSASTLEEIRAKIDELLDELQQDIEK